jgi:hypothetical protein
MQKDARLDVEGNADLMSLGMISEEEDGGVVLVQYRKAWM